MCTDYIAVRRYTVHGEFQSEYSSLDIIDRRIRRRVEMCCRRVDGYAVVDGSQWRFDIDDEFDPCGVVERFYSEKVVDETGEIWKPLYGRYKSLPGGRPRYEVSNFGNVRGWHHVGFKLVKTLLKQRITKRGCYEVFVRIVGRSGAVSARVHLLMAEAFLPNIYGSRTVRHKDGNKLNNRLENIEWAVPVDKRVEKVAGKPVRQYSTDGQLIAEFPSIIIAMQATGINDSTIGNCCRRKKSYKTAGGFIWRFVSDDELCDLEVSPVAVRRRKAVTQYSLDGKVISEYVSISAGAEDTGISFSSISMCCRGKSPTAGGYIWRFAEDPFERDSEWPSDEAWRPVSLFPVKAEDGITKYEVSSRGRVRYRSGRVGRKLCSLTRNKTCMTVMLYDNNHHGTSFRVDLLVATEFLTNPYKFDSVCHKDGNIENNDVINLEWWSADEKWLPVDETHNVRRRDGSWRYEVSNYGRVRHSDYVGRGGKYHPPHIMYQGDVKGGRYTVNLSDGNNNRMAVFVHRLVALAFIPNPEGLEFVRHKDDNFGNNHVSNLFWSSKDEVVDYSVKRRLESWRAKGVALVRQYDFSGKLITEYSTADDAGRKLGISVSGIRASCRRESCTGHGFVWRYAADDDLLELEEYERASIIRSMLVQIQTPVKAIRQYTLDGKFVAEYPSIAEAMRSTGANTKIGYVCARKPGFNQCCGFLWRYADDDELFDGSVNPGVVEC